MSASTRTLQQPVRVGPLAFVVVLAAIILCAAIALALSSVGPKGQAVPGAAAGAATTPLAGEGYADFRRGEIGAGAVTAPLGGEGYADFRRGEIGAGEKAPHGLSRNHAPRLEAR